MPWRAIKRLACGSDYVWTSPRRPQFAGERYGTIHQPTAGERACVRTLHQRDLHRAIRSTDGPEYDQCGDLHPHRALPCADFVTAASVVLDTATGTVATFTPLSAMTSGGLYTATIIGAPTASRISRSGR